MLNYLLRFMNILLLHKKMHLCFALNICCIVVHYLKIVKKQMWNWRWNVRRALARRIRSVISIASLPSIIEMYELSQWVSNVAFTLRKMSLSPVASMIAPVTDALLHQQISPRVQRAWRFFHGDHRYYIDHKWTQRERHRRAYEIVVSINWASKVKKIQTGFQSCTERWHFVISFSNKIWIYVTQN